MKITDLSDGEILLKLERLAVQNNIHLTFANKTFYISLLHFCEDLGEYDDSSKEYFVELSVSAFVEEFHLSHTTVTQSLKRLSECGAIRREKHKRAFRKLGKGEYVTNSAYRTYLNVVYLTVV
jgi:predicted transcriptional regulator